MSPPRSSGGARAPAFSPNWRRTVHCLGDLHAGAITSSRLGAVSSDIARLGTPALHLQIGDVTERGTPKEDELARRFLSGLPAPWATVLGNHDILGNRRTVREWAKAYGQRAQNFTVELGFVRIVAVGPNGGEAGKRAGRLSVATLDFLERELDRDSGDCWIACHWPLLRSVMGDPRLHFTSAMDAFHAKPDERIRELLARHANAKLWLSGHTHSPLSAPGLIRRMRLAPRRSIVAINTSALVAVGQRRDPRDPLCSIYLTKRRDRVEARFRDHRAGAWRTLQGRYVIDVSV